MTTMRTGAVKDWPFAVEEGWAPVITAIVLIPRQKAHLLRAMREKALIF
jgi:hypothetical protein